MTAALAHSIEGEGSPVVLLHPVGLDRSCWDALIARLGGPYKLLRVDLRGHGGSPDVDPDMALADYAADVAALMQATGFGSAALVGLSFGGMVAQEVAIHGSVALSRLVVAGCPCTLPGPARTALAARGRAALESGMEALLGETLERWFTSGFLAAHGAEAIEAQLRRMSPVGWNSAWRAISRVDTAPRLVAVQVPTLCVAGALDPASPPAALAEIARRVGGARLAVLPETPHMMQIERADLFAPLLERFLSGEHVGDTVV